MGSFLLEKEVEGRVDLQPMPDLNLKFRSGMLDLESETDRSHDLFVPTEVVPF